MKCSNIKLKKSLDSVNSSFNLSLLIVSSNRGLTISVSIYFLNRLKTNLIYILLKNIIVFIAIDKWLNFWFAHKSNIFLVIYLKTSCFTSCNNFKINQMNHKLESYVKWKCLRTEFHLKANCLKS
jgi:hypothetical protein